VRRRQQKEKDIEKFRIDDRAHQKNRERRESASLPPCTQGEEITMKYGWKKFNSI
jgi:hypothetical protein